MNTQTHVTHDDVDRHADGAAVGISELLPDNEHGRKARYHARNYAAAAHLSLDAAGVPREVPPEE